VVAHAFRRLGALLAIIVLAPAVTYVIYGSVYGSIYGHVTIWHQLANDPQYLVRVFGHLDLGYDDAYAQPMSQSFREGLPIDLALVVGGLVVGLAGGILTGLVAGPRPRSVPDAVLTLGSSIVMSMPVYLISLIVIVEVAATTGDHPVSWVSGPGQYVPITHDPVRWLQSLWVPWLIVGAPLGAVTFRMTRQVLHEELGADHIRTARAKGLTERMVVRRHALRAGLPAILSLAAVSVPVLVFNTILVETAMEIHGMFARLDVSPQVGVVHIPSIDLIQGLVLDSAIVIAVGLFFCGLLHDRLDPQVRR